MVFLKRNLLSLTCTCLISFAAQASLETSSMASTMEQKDTNGIAGTNQHRNSKSGIGFSFGARFFNPSQVNDLLDDMYDELTSGSIIVYEFGTPKLFLATVFKIKGIIYPIPFLCIEPFAQVLWGPKMLNANGSASLHLIDLSGGLNLWAKINPKSRVSFKMGAGAFWGYDVINVSGDLGSVSFDGFGYGFNALAGIDASFKRVAVNVDIIVPFGKIPLKMDGMLEGYDFRYPGTLSLTGVEIRPGITFHF